jgi:hypothetical protein
MSVGFWDNNGKPMTTTFQATSGQIITGTGFSFSNVSEGKGVEDAKSGYLKALDGVNKDYFIHLVGEPR